MVQGMDLEYAQTKGKEKILEPNATASKNHSNWNKEQGSCEEARERDQL